MGQINLYRIDGHKKTEFVNQLDDKFFRLESMMG